VLLFSSIYHSTLFFFANGFQHFSFLQTAIPVLPVFVVKNNAVQYRSLQWVKSHEKIDCDEGVTSYDLRV